MIFADPLYLLLLLLLIPLIIWYIMKQKKTEPWMLFSSTKAFGAMPKSYKVYLRHVRFALRLLAIAAIIVALARPQATDNWENSSTEGIDIVIALDISTSMLARDLKPDRIEAAKEVAAEFISGRRNDNIGLVIFAGESFSMCPMTIDHATLQNQLSQVHCGMLEDRTAIGEGLATAVNRIKDGKAKSKAIILLTDGTNNAGNISPETAAEIAKTFGVRVYTIGIGTNGTAPTPFSTPYGGVVYQNVPVEFDEATLQKIAGMTGGEYFRATNNRVLRDIFKDIDKLEKTKISVQQFSRKDEEYRPWLLLAFILLLCDFSLRNTVLRNIP